MDELEKRSQKGLSEFKKDGNIEDVKSSLDSMIDDMFDDPDDAPSGEAVTDPSQKSVIIKWGLALFSVLLLAWLGYRGFIDGSGANVRSAEETAQVLFAQYFEPMDDITSDVRRGDSETDGVSNKGMQFYKLRQYDQAAKLLLANEDAESQFYGALSLLANGDAKRAAELLGNMITDSSYDKYSDIIQWYHGLALMTSDEREQAKKVFENISGKEAYKSKESRIILKTL